MWSPGFRYPSTVSTMTAFWNGRSWPFWSKRTLSDCTVAGLWPGTHGPAWYSAET